MYVTVAPERDWKVRYEDREENWTTKSERCLVRCMTAMVGSLMMCIRRAGRGRCITLTTIKQLYPQTGFMEVWREDGRWTERDSIVASRGGRELSVRSLDKHFDGGYNDHTSEPSHHIPDLYAMAGAVWTTQESDRVIARILYRGSSYLPNSNPSELSSPLFESLTLYIPAAPRPLHTSALGAQTKKCIKSLTMKHTKVTTPFVKHQWIKDGREVKRWCDEGVLREFGGAEEEIKQVEWEDG
ncbi:hypothetical protein BJ165DRAFT_1406880 [Panaeolus papilionaceus]|nr:hypothetical protein BJ165DRAFT_1406880 [Panaeolus papilionaceus]